LPMVFPCPIAVSKNWAIVDCSRAGSDYTVLLVVYAFSAIVQKLVGYSTRCDNDLAHCCQDVTVDGIHRIRCV
jgi:hypothetical protein